MSYFSGDTDWELEAGTIRLATAESPASTRSTIAVCRGVLDAGRLGEPQVHVNQASNNATLNVWTSLLVAGNAKDGRFECSRPKWGANRHWPDTPLPVRSDVHDAEVGEPGGV